MRPPARVTTFAIGRVSSPPTTVGHVAIARARRRNDAGRLCPPRTQHRCAPGQSALNAPSRIQAILSPSKGRDESPGRALGVVCLMTRLPHVCNGIGHLEGFWAYGVRFPPGRDYPYPARTPQARGSPASSLGWDYTRAAALLLHFAVTVEHTLSRAAQNARMRDRSPSAR